MNPRAVAAAAFLSLAVLFTAYTVASHAAVVSQLPPIGPYPDAPCEDPDAHGTNIYVGADGNFWECICEHRTFVKPDCAWYNQGPITRSQKLRIKAQYHVRVIPRLRVLVLS